MMESPKIKIKIKESLNGATAARRKSFIRLIIALNCIPKREKNSSRKGIRTEIKRMIKRIIKRMIIKVIILLLL